MRLAAALLLAASCGGERAAMHEVVVTRGALGVRFQVAVRGADEEQARQWAEDSFDAVEMVEGVLDRWTPGTDLSELNADTSAGWTEVAVDLAEVAAQALAFHDRTGGAFDPTVGPLLAAWGFREGLEGRVPTEQQLAEAKNRVGGLKVEARRWPPALRRAVAGMEIDLGALTKGVAVDRVASILGAQGVPHLFITAGGSTVYAGGDSAEGDGWPLELPNGERWRLHDQAVSTSGRMSLVVEAEGEEWSHILDPRTGRPVANGVAWAVFRGPSAAEADMASTALLVMGPREARAWWTSQGSRMDGRGAMLILEGGAEVKLGTCALP